MRGRVFRIFVVLIVVITGSWGIWFAVTRHSLNPSDAQGNPVPILWLDGDALWGWSGLMKRPACFNKELDGLWWSVTMGGKVGLGRHSEEVLDEWAIERIADHYRKRPPFNAQLQSRLWQALKWEAQEIHTDRHAFEACLQVAQKHLAGKDLQPRFFLPAFARFSHRPPSDPLSPSQASGSFWVFGFAWGMRNMVVPNGMDLGHVYWVVVDAKPPHNVVNSFGCG